MCGSVMLMIVVLSIFMNVVSVMMIVMSYGFVVGCYVLLDVLLCLGGWFIGGFCEIGMMCGYWVLDCFG